MRCKPQFISVLVNFFRGAWRTSYSGIRQWMCVRIVRTLMRSKMKCSSTTLRQTVTVLHSMRIAHTTFSEQYIIIKSCFYYFYSINAALLLIQFWYFLCILQYVFYMKNKNTHQLRVTATSMGGKVRYTIH